MTIDYEQKQLLLEVNLYMNSALTDLNDASLS